MAVVWSAAGYWHISWLSILVVQGLLPVASVYLTRLLVDALVDSLQLGASWEAARPTLVFAALMVGVLGLTELLRALLDWIGTAQAELVQDHISRLVHGKTMALDLSFYDSPEYYDRVHRVRSDSSSRSLSMMENIGGLLQNGITLFAMAGVLLPYGWWIPLVLFVGTLPALVVVLHFNRRHHHWWNETTADRRWAQYYDLMLTTGQTAAELRLFDLGGPFQATYQLLRKRLRRERVALSRDQIGPRLIAGGSALLAMGLTVAWMIWRALQGLATLGDLALFQQAFSRGQNLMRTLLENVGRIYSNSLFVRDLFLFLEMEPRVQEAMHPVPVPRQLQQGILFRDVTFAYAGSAQPAVRNLTLTIPAGQTVAIVGPNGAGKSSLVKLLCRFYDPTGGRIEFDGTDIRDFSVADLRRMMSVLFQLPVQYHATAGQNIALGDNTATPSVADIEGAARAAGASDIVSRLPKGYDTLLGRHFADGAELSAGQWQRFALARAFFRRAPIIVLDEPTSFMDSWAEADWLDRFQVLAHGRTAMLITHRFTTARRAHLIFVIRDGQVIEHGSHAELVELRGFYADSWQAQVRAGSSATV
jgi:ATP-binding cassette subfamily B protein